MGSLDELKGSRPESVQILEAARFEWVNQGPSGEIWRGYIFVKRDGTVVKFSYQDIADHGVDWIRQRLAPEGLQVSHAGGSDV